MSKPVVLILASYYLPGFRAGGPIRSIANMVEHLHDDFSFKIITGDRDLSSENSFDNLPINQWCNVGLAQVYYCSPERQTVANFSKIINDIRFDVLYINSFFSSNFSIKPLIAIYFKLIDAKAIILAPRGEFSKGALRLKSFKKKWFISFSKLLGLYQDVAWHASSQFEMEDIIKNISAVPDQIFIAPNLSLAVKKIDFNEEKEQTNSILRIVFLSRISPMKNLDFALEVLAAVKENVIFDIYGPAEDKNYWQECQKIIARLPKNISVKFYGAVKPEEVRDTFSKYDLFFFPTRGENFGHVIAESLVVGTPVLISDQTPWKNMEADQLGWEVALQLGKSEFAEIIEKYSLKTHDEREEKRAYIQNVMAKRLMDTTDIEANRQLFLNVI